MANRFDIGKISFYFIVQDNIIGWEITSCRMVQKLWKLVMLFRGLGIIKTIETNELQYCLDGLKWVLHINVLGDNTFPFRHKSIHHYRETFPSFVHVMQIFRSYMTDNILSISKLCFSQGSLHTSGFSIPLISWLMSPL